MLSNSNTTYSSSTAPIHALPSHGYDLDSESNSTHNRVLVVDDDPDFITMTKLILCQAGFDVAGALGCSSALEKCSMVKPDVILLDLMMPEVDGFETYERLKKVTRAPVIVVTASGDRENAAKSLRSGMEDYISKPFYNAEMIERVRAVLRRAGNEGKENTRAFPDIDLFVNFDTQEVYLNGKYIRLVPRQFLVLSILAKQAPRPVNYTMLTEEIWGEDAPKNRAHLKNIIFSMRQKLEMDPTHPRLVVNYRGLGYQLVVQS